MLFLAICLSIKEYIIDHRGERKKYLPSENILDCHLTLNRH